jgi:hypothetical protein
MIKYLPLMMLLVSCGYDDPPPFHQKHTPRVDVGDFGHYVDEFVVHSHENGTPLIIHDLIMKWHDIPDEEGKTILGRCFIGDQLSNTVEIDPVHWEEMDEQRRMLLIHHELGHCLLRRDHFDDKPSIMNTYLLSSKKYEEDSDGIMAELFDPTKYGSFTYLHLHDDGYTCGGSYK